jgi:hypothetical protein
MDPGRRRNLAEAASAEIGTGRWHALLDFRLIGPDDLGWLIGQLPVMPVPAHQALAACVPAPVRHPTADQADRILGLAEDHPAYEATRFLRDPLAPALPRRRNGGRYVSARPGTRISRDNPRPALRSPHRGA